MNDTDRLIDRMARQSLGLVLLDRLLAEGITRKEVESRRASGKLVRVQESVYHTFGAEASWLQALLAACWAAGPDAAASHRAAAFLWDLWRELAPVELSVPRAQCPVPTRTVLHRSLDLTADQVRLRQSIPATSPARTLLDLGAVMPMPAVAYAVEVGLQKRLTTIAELQAMLDRHGRKGRRGAGVLREVLGRRALATERPESVLEAMFARLMRVLGNAVVYQHEVVIGGGRIRRLDFAVPDALVGLEVDSEAHHATLPDRIADRERQNELTALGWTLLRYGAPEMRRRPAAVTREIVAVVEQRRRLLGRSRPA